MLSSYNGEVSLFDLKEFSVVISHFFNGWNNVVYILISINVIPSYFTVSNCYIKKLSLGFVINADFIGSFFSVLNTRRTAIRYRIAEKYTMFL